MKSRELAEVRAAVVDCKICRLSLSLEAMLSLFLVCSSPSSLLLKAVRECAVSDSLWASSTSFTHTSVAFMDLTFGYAGQVIPVEIRSSVVNPAEDCPSPKVNSCDVERGGVSDVDAIGTTLGNGLISINAFIVLRVPIADAVEGNSLAQGEHHSISRGEDSSRVEFAVSRESFRNKSSSSPCPDREKKFPM